MTQVLRQSTEVIVRMGPFVDVGDGFTPEIAITLGAADEAEAMYAGGGASVDISGNTWAPVTGADGWYDLTLTTANTANIGTLDVVVQDDSVCLPVHVRFQVIEESAFDFIYASGADPDGQMAQAISDTAVIEGWGLSSVASDTARIESDTTQLDNAIVRVGGTADAGSTTTMDDAALTQADDYWNGCWLVMRTGNAADQVREITDFDATNDRITVSPAFTAAVAAADTYTIISGVGGIQQAASDTTVIEGWGLGSVASDTAAIEVDTGTTLSAQITTIASDLVETYSDTTIIEGWGLGSVASDTAAIEVDTGTTLSAQITTIASDVVEIYSDTTAIHSDTTIMSSGLVTGSCEGTPSTTVIQTDLAETTDDHYIGRIVVFTSGPCLYQATDITAYTGSTGTITVTALVAPAPNSGDTFTIY